MRYLSSVYSISVIMDVSLCCIHVHTANAEALLLADGNDS
jgi:hypothetical protein